MSDLPQRSGLGPPSDAPVHLVLGPVPGEDVAAPDAQALARYYVELIRRQPPVRVDPVQLPNVRRPLQIAGAVCALALYAATASFLLRPSVNLAAQPPAAVLAIEADDPGVRRQAEIMRAVAAYARDHGAAPQQLDHLTPHYLAAVPAEPTSGQPYEYMHQGRGGVVAYPSSGQNGAGVMRRQRGSLSN